MDTVQLERLLADSLLVSTQRSTCGWTVLARVRTVLATIQTTPTEVAWLATGWPRQIRDLLDRPDRPGLVVASELSQGARKLLTGERAVVGG